MAQYIDKSALVAEIDRRIKVLQKYPYENHKTICHLDSLKQSIDTLEVKEVDLEKEIEQYVSSKGLRDYGFLIPTIAQHFFELGIKAQKDNIRHSMDETPNYPCDILLVTNVDNMFLYRYMENGRPVDYETPSFHNILNGKCWYYCNDIANK